MDACMGSWSSTGDMGGGDEPIRTGEPPTLMPAPMPALVESVALGELHSVGEGRAEGIARCESGVCTLTLLAWMAWQGMAWLGMARMAMGSGCAVDIDVDGTARDFTGAHGAGADGMGMTEEVRGMVATGTEGTGGRAGGSVAGGSVAEGVRAKGTVGRKEVSGAAWSAREGTAKPEIAVGEEGDAAAGASAETCTGESGG